MKKIKSYNNFFYLNSPLDIATRNSGRGGYSPLSCVTASRWSPSLALLTDIVEEMKQTKYYQLYHFSHKKNYCSANIIRLLTLTTDDRANGKVDSTLGLAEQWRECGRIHKLGMYLPHTLYHPWLIPWGWSGSWCDRGSTRKSWIRLHCPVRWSQLTKVRMARCKDGVGGSCTYSSSPIYGTVEPLTVLWL